MGPETLNVSTVMSYLLALESGVTGQALAAFFTTDAVQIEKPSRLNPRGAKSDLPALLRRAEKGRALLRNQRYQVDSVVAQQDIVAVEARWSGTLAVPFDTIGAGATLTARFAMFFEMSSGHIRMQRNYDCFELSSC